MDFADRLKLLRNERSLKQQDIADILNVERPTIAGYETKRKQPDYEKIKILADYFNVSLDYLLGQSDIKNPYSNNEKIGTAVNDDPELYEFWNTLKEREDLKILFKQTKDLSPNDVKKMIRIMKAIEDEEDRNDG